MIDETLRAFADQDVPPSRLLAEDILAGARRHHRRRRAALTAGAAGLTVLVLLGAAVAVRLGTGGNHGLPAYLPAVPATAPSGCVAARLTMPPAADPHVLIVGVDPTGHHVIGQEPGVLWTDGVPHRLAAGFTPQAVNASGLVVGIKGALETRQPAMTSGGAVQLLPLPAGAQGGEALAVNSHGDAAGTAYWPDNTSRAVRWHTSAPVKVTVLAGGDAAATGITDDGVVIGTRAVPERWTADGAEHPLPLPAGLHSGSVGATGGDWAIGWVRRSAPDPQAKGDDPAAERDTPVRWNVRTGAVQALSGFVLTQVSASGTVAGRGPGPGAAADDHTVADVPVIWRDGHLIHLPLLDPAVADYLAGITADGHTIVGGSVAGGATVAVIWHNC